MCDGVSSRVLALNLPLTGESPSARLCAAAPGEPVWLTLRSLTGTWTACASNVFVWENPTIAEAAADALGPTCPPLVCTDGIASGAALDLLAGLAAAGCTIHARADFDLAGFTIADQVLSVASGALSWRFNARTYAEECGLSGHHDAPTILRPRSPGYGSPTTVRVPRCTRSGCSPCCCQTSWPEQASPPRPPCPAMGPLTWVDTTLGICRVVIRNDALATYRLMQAVRRLVGRHARARAGVPTPVVE